MTGLTFALASTEFASQPDIPSDYGHCRQAESRDRAGRRVADLAPLALLAGLEVLGKTWSSRQERHGARP